MPIDPVFFVVLALALGFKHSYDADHLVAVSNLLTRSKSLRKTTLMSVSWAAGHMITATIVTVLLYEFRATVLQGVLANLELAIAVMLVVIGVVGLLVEFGLIHRHGHRHESEEHTHVHLPLHEDPQHRTMFGIGIGVSYPVARWGTGRVRRAVSIAAALLSIFYAALLFLGFEGVNLLPFSAA